MIQATNVYCSRPTSEAYIHFWNTQVHPQIYSNLPIYSLPANSKRRLPALLDPLPSTHLEEKAIDLCQGPNHKHKAPSPFHLHSKEGTAGRTTPTPACTPSASSPLHGEEACVTSQPFPSRRLTAPKVP